MTGRLCTYSQAVKEIDYCLSSIGSLIQGIWMSFFDTEEAHAVMLAYAANGGGLPWRADMEI